MIKTNAQRLQDFETMVLHDATHFSVIKMVDGGPFGKLRREHEDHTTLSSAIVAAMSWNDAHRRPALIYAVTAAGRSVHLAQHAWPEHCRQRGERLP